VALGLIPDARAVLARAQSLSGRIGVPVPSILYSQYLLCATVDEGWEQLADLFTALTSSLNPALAWTLGFLYAGQAAASAHLGMVDEAMGTLDNLVPWLGQAPVWTAGFTAMASAAAEVLWLLGRTDHLEVVERALREKVLPSGLSYAMADPRLALARLCAVDGRHDEALEWFAEARRALDEEGAQPLRAVCDFDEATMRLGRAAAGDAEAAGDLRAKAIRQFEALGMTGWLRRAEALPV
jgi:tetratricopeptide (TPR) repeat protein